MRTLRKPKSNRSDEPIVAKVPLKPDGKKEAENAELAKLKAQVKKLKKENASLKGGPSLKMEAEVKVPLAIRNNVNKIIKAIEIESKIQKTDKPVIGSTKMRKTYKINKDHFPETLQYAKENGIFDRNKISYSGKVETFEWRSIKRQ